MTELTLFRTELYRIDRPVPIYSHILFLFKMCLVPIPILHTFLIISCHPVPSSNTFDRFTTHALLPLGLQAQPHTYLSKNSPHLN